MADTPAPLSSADARKLGLWAKKTHHQSLNWLRGYLFSLAALPLPLPRERLLGPLAAGEMAALLEQQFAVLEHELIQARSKLPANCGLQEDFRDNFQQGTGLSDWCRGFDDAMGMIFSCWEVLLPQLEESLTEELDACWCMLSFFADIQEAAEMMRPTAMTLEESCQQVRRDMPRIIKAYAEISLELRHILSLRNDLIEPAMAALPDELPPQLAEGDEDHPGGLEMLWEEAMQAEDLSERETLLRSALKTAEAELGEQAFQDHAGHFWMVMETRPYMQALALLAECLQMQQRLPEAMELAERAIQLCPSDNLGLRYPLIGMLLESHQYSRVHALMEQYDESSVFFHYARALLGFVEQRGSLKATTARKRAVKANPHFARMLRQQSPLPEERAPYYSPGDESEAVMLLEFMGNAWYGLDGAVRWLSSKG